MDTIVVKAGGGLLRGGLPPAFVGWLRGRPERVLLLPGGGAAADAVRAWHADLGLAEEVSHRLALHAMGLAGRLWSEVLPAPRAAGLAAACAASAPLTVLDAAEDAAADPRLPASWDATADTVAAWATRRLGLRVLVLAKSVGPPADLAEAAARGWLDPCFRAQAEGLEVRWLNARATPWREPRAVA